MKKFKFRYMNADGKPYYKQLTLPNDATLLIGYDADGREVYNGDIVETAYYYDEDGLLQEYLLSADLAVMFTDERGKIYSPSGGFTCAL